MPINRKAVISRSNALKYESLYFDIEITRKYLAKMSQLEYVLISVDYHSLYFTHDSMRDFLYYYYYRINYRNEVQVKNRVSLLYGYGLKDGLSILSNEPLNITNGWAGWKTTNYDSPSEITGRQKIQYFNNLISNNISEKKEIVSRLDAFLKLLKSNNITPIFFSLPCHKMFNQNLDEEMVSQNEITIKKMSNQNNIRHLNYQFYDLPDSCFYNVDHLNKKGASIISKKINNDILNSVEHINSEVYLEVVSNINCR